MRCLFKIFLALVAIAAGSHGAYAMMQYSDVSTNEGDFKSIQYLSERGVFQGYSDDTFRPNNTVNRAELLKILIAGFHQQEIKNENNCFPDVHDEWFAPYVCAAKRLGWIQGYPDGTFHPAQAVNRAEGMKILISSLGMDVTSYRLPYFDDVKKEDWFAPFVGKATEHEIYEWRTHFEPSVPLVRWQIAQWVYNDLIPPDQERKKWSEDDLKGQQDGICSEDEIGCYGEMPDVTCWSRNPDCQFDDVLKLPSMQKCVAKDYFTLRARNSITISCVPTQ